MYKIKTGNTIVKEQLTLSEAAVVHAQLRTLNPDSDYQVVSDDGMVIFK